MALSPTGQQGKREEGLLQCLCGGGGNSRPHQGASGQGLGPGQGRTLQGRGEGASPMAAARSRRSPQ